MPKKFGNRRLVGFRLPEKDLVILDALVDKYNQIDRVVEYSRTDILRMAIQMLGEKVLPDLDKERRLPN